MIGPKLDARSYTTLLLVVVACLLTLNLAAQIDFSSRSVRAQENPVDRATDAGATQAVAAANSEIAAANREIAASIRALAQAVSRLELKVEMPAGGHAGGSSPVATGGNAGIPADAAIPYEGSFNIN